MARYDCARLFAARGSNLRFPQPPPPLRRSAYFAVYQSCKQVLLARVHAPPLLLIAFSAIVANTIAVTFRVPCELVKQRIQAGVYSSTLEAVRKISEAHGFGGFLPREPWLAQLARDLQCPSLTMSAASIIMNAWLGERKLLWLPAKALPLPTLVRIDPFTLILDFIPPYLGQADGCFAPPNLRGAASPAPTRRGE